MLNLSKLRICYLAGTFGQGGAERQLFYAIQALRRSGAEVEVLSFERGGFWEDPIKKLGVTVTWVGQSASRLNRVCCIVKHLKKHPPDILQAQHFYTNAYASVSSLFLNCPGIGALRSNGYFDVTQSGWLGGRINLRLPRFIAANSRSSIQYAIQHGVPTRRLFFLPNVVDTDRFKCAAPQLLNNSGKAPQASITLLTAGRLTREKRFDRFISLLHELRTVCGLDVRGCIVGPTRADQDLRSALERQAAALNLRSDALQFFGSAAEMLSLYQQASIFVLTSDNEGTPNVLLEAMSTGLPVVATSVGGVPEIVQHGRNGFLVSPHDPTELTNATRRLIEDPILRQKIGAQGRSYVEETHSLNRLPAYLAQLYELALGIPARLGPQAARGFVTTSIGSARMLRFAFRPSNDHEKIV
jgi:glycosyltransferase involved in cell wall biosynthesis